VTARSTTRRGLALWFSAAVLLGALAIPVLALAGALSWEVAGALFVLIGCLGSVIEELVTRARNHAAGESPGLSAGFIGLVVLGALTGLALAVWLN
jgi:hypothetical protein